ncbi:MAG: methyltransferase [Pseudomonadota bacterium]
MKDLVDPMHVPGLAPLHLQAEGYPEEIFITPDVQIELIKDGSRQFREDAAVYDERWSDLDSLNAEVLKRCQSLFPDFDLASVKHALDIGCGSGNATFPILSAANEAAVYATDISPDMVSILVERARRRNQLNRVLPFVSDAERVQLEPNSFDLIFGSSMVHHLVDPDAFLDRIFASLRSGGICLFTEPFKAGHQILRHFIEEMSNDGPYSIGIPEKIQKFFRSYIYTVDMMCTLDRTQLDYTKLEDKWMFPRRFFDDAARRNGMTFASFAIDPVEHGFLDNVEKLVWRGLGEKWQVPEPARSFVKRFDDPLPADLYEELLTAGCVVFKK